MDILITIPKTTKWSEYEKELEAVKDGENVLNFKVAAFPKNLKVGDRCYVTYAGFIIGFMIVSGLSSHDFTCKITGSRWSGDFIQRSGDFHKLKYPIPYKGFQGFRYLADDFIIKNKLTETI